MTFAIKRMVRPRVAPVRSFTNPRRVDRDLADEILSQFIPLNDYAPVTFTNATANRHDQFNRRLVAANERRRRPFRFRGKRTIWADLIEGSRTNLCIRSSDFANWATQTDVTITTAALTPYDGTGSADRILEGSAGTAALTSAAMTITAGRIVTSCVRFKFKATNNWVMVTLASNSLANGWRVWANISTGVVGTQSAIGTGAVVGTALLTSLGNGEYLLCSMGTVAAAATTCQISVCSASADASTTRVTAADYYAWGAQVEMMAASATTGNPSSLIGTTTVAVTRAADVLTVPYVLGQTGTVLALVIPSGWTADQDGISSWRIMQDNNTSSRINRNSATNVVVSRADAGGIETANMANGLSAGALSHIAMTWDASAVSCYVAGILGAQDTTLTPPYLANTSLGIGCTTAGGSQAFSHVALLTRPDRVLTAPELLAIQTVYPTAQAA